MKKNTKTKKVYSKDQTAVILENISSQFKVFGEAQSLLSDKADNLGIKVDAIDERLENVEAKINIMDKRLENVEVKVDVINERLVRMEDDVVEIKHKLSEKVDLEDFKKLEKRLVSLEKIVLEKI